jgi:hypothetical protein
MLTIDIPNAAYADQTVVLNQQNFTVTTKYRLRSDRWTVTLTDAYGNVLLAEAKCISNTFLTGRYIIPELGGELYVCKMYGDDEQPTRNNFGEGKQFELHYYSNEELGVS